MLTIRIPGREDMTIEHVALDYNGTIAVDGVLCESLKERLAKLSENVKLYVLTADTYGNVRKQCQDLPLDVCTFDRPGAAACKQEIVEKLGAHVCAIGNGFNDMAMFEKAALSIAVMGREGTCGKLLTMADLVVGLPEDALDLLLYPDRIRAGLRT